MLRQCIDDVRQEIAARRADADPQTVSHARLHDALQQREGRGHSLELEDTSDLPADAFTLPGKPLA